MFAVCVTFEIAPDHIGRFRDLVLAQAQTSIRSEPGCRRFDVLVDEDTPNEVFLYELYDDATAFDTHLESDHFRTFDADVKPMIKHKVVKTYRDVRS